MVKKTEHTFMVCAYKESPFLEESIISLLEQSVKTNIEIATSTPNDYISGIADKYKLGIHINDTSSGIAGDWNFAYSKAQTELVTLCHQDDVFKKDYLENIMSALSSNEDVLIVFTDYAEIKKDKHITQNLLLIIKKIMLLPLRWKCNQTNIAIRRAILSFGCPICCPSVTYSRKNLKNFSFSNKFKCNLDWDAWERISREKGRFVYINKTLTLHRIHEESETSVSIADKTRHEEDSKMYEKFWPVPIASLLHKLYSLSEKSNKEK